MAGCHPNHDEILSIAVKVYLMICNGTVVRHDKTYTDYKDSLSPQTHIHVLCLSEVDSARGAHWGDHLSTHSPVEIVALGGLRGKGECHCVCMELGPVTIHTYLHHNTWPGRYPHLNH